MTSASPVRRALVPAAVLAAAALGAVGCDVVSLLSDPAPIVEQTWNLPATSNAIWVKDLLPTNGSVTIPADSSMFLVKVDSTTLTRIVGNDCAQCVILNGTNAPKPQFILNTSNSTGLPTDILSAALLGGDTLSVRLVNNMSFDPIYVNTTPGAPTQGFMVIVVKSGATVLARDSVRGAATSVDAKNMPFPKSGGVLIRKIVLASGTATTNITVDVTINSPVGDHSEFINSNGTLNASAKVVPTLSVGSVTMNVPSRNVNSGGGDSLPKFENSSLVKGTLEMTITNPFTSVTGNLNVKFDYGPGASDNITKVIALPSGSGVRTVSLDSMEIQTIFKQKSKMTVTGSVSSPSAITVTPKQVVTIDNRLIATVHLGGK